MNAVKIIKKLSVLLCRFGACISAILVFVLPVSPNYKLDELNITSGGGITQSNNYGAEQSVGETSTTNMLSTSYKSGFGFGFTQMAQVPPAPTLSNPSNYYDRLKLVVNPGANASDAVFLVAISSDGFATTSYVQPDGTVNSTKLISDYQDYGGWGGASGVTIVGLSPSTTYQVKLKAKQGNYTESGFGPTASASTVASSMSFDIDVSPTDQSTSPPYSTDLGSLLPNTVVTSNDKIWISLDTNASNGGMVYVSGQHGGLYSPTAKHPINSISGDLTSQSEGFGLQGSSATQGSGGPLTLVSPYNGNADTIGMEDTSLRQIFTSTGPITSGRGSFVLKAKASASTPAASDYSEVLTVVGSASF